MYLFSVTVDVQDYASFRCIESDHRDKGSARLRMS